MLIRDEIYGDVEITEPVLTELLNSSALLRLQKIQQFGTPNKYLPYPGYSRYKHSVGVLLLLRRLGANIEEQVAGLTHDVSHTAFSHIIDWVVGSTAKEDFQDSNHRNYIYTSKLNEVFLKHGFDPEKLAVHYHYTLLEQDSPALCADRIDYA